VTLDHDLLADYCDQDGAIMAKHCLIKICFVRSLHGAWG